MKKAMMLTISLFLSTFVLSGSANNTNALEEKTYTPDGQVSAIRLDVEDREIDVSLSEDDRIHIAYYANEKEYYDISVSDDHVLTMVSASKKKWTDFFGRKASSEYRKIGLQVPNGLLRDVTLSTTDENILLPALAVTGDISISCNGGNIMFESLDVGNALSLTAKNGDITGTVVGSYEDFSIQTKIKKGNSNLPENKEGGGKSLTVSCNNGDIDIQFKH